MRRFARFIPLILWMAAIAILLIEKRRLAAGAAALLALVLFAPGFTRWNRLILVSISISLLAHSVALFTMLDRQMIALTVAAAGVILFWRSRSRVSRGQIRDLRVALTWVLMLAGVVHFLARGTGSSVSETARADATASNSSKSGNDGFGDFTGVILVPDAPKPKLIPPLPDQSLEASAQQDKNPLTIPFTGVYWFFRFPKLKPPDDAAILHGTPDDIRFRSAGRVDLQMEARQDLGKLMDTTRFSRIEVSLLNAEAEHAEMFAETVLSNSRIAGEPRQSLGLRRIDSSAKQTLLFQISRYPTLEQFDVLTVRIRRWGTLATQSARITVQGFVLTSRVL